VALRRQRALAGGAGAGYGANPYHGWGETDPAEAADALLQLWVDPARALAIGRRGRALIGRHMTWRRFRSRLRRLIRRQRAR
jgi:glycosyltransferase involved in cell wall biosynthesis